MTPGHAIRILQIHGAGGHQLIRSADFLRLCNSSRPGKKRDAKVISTALKEFKRCNKFVLNKDGGRLALEGMMRSMMPNYKIVYGMPKIEAASYALRQILDERTGLYFTVETSTVDGILEKMKEGLDEMVGRGLNIRVDMSADEAEGEGNDTSELSDDEKALKSALEATDGIIKLLIKRRTGVDMKKRALRNYMKFLKVKTGPWVTTMSLATQISLAIGGLEYTKANIFDPYNEAWWNQGVHKSVLELVKEVEAKDEAERVAREAAAAALVADADEQEIVNVGDSDDAETVEDEKEGETDSTGVVGGVEDAKDVENK
jgi:hypothetical protein